MRNRRKDTSGGGDGLLKTLSSHGRRANAFCLTRFRQMRTTDRPDCFAAQRGRHLGLAFAREMEIEGVGPI